MRHKFHLPRSSRSRLQRSRRRLLRRRLNPDFLYSDAELQRLADLQAAREGGNFVHYGKELQRLEKAAAAAANALHRKHTREAEAIADRYDALHRRKPSRSFIPSYIHGTPLHLRPREGQPYRSPWDLGYKVRKGEGTAAEYAKLFKKFPSRMTYALLPPPEEVTRGAEAHDHDEVHRRARAVGARLRPHPLDFSGMIERNAMEREKHFERLRQDAERKYPAPGDRERRRARRVDAVARGRRLRPRRMPAEEIPVGRSWWEEYEWSPDGMTIAGRRRNPVTKRLTKGKRRARAAARLERVLIMRAMRGNPAYGRGRTMTRAQKRALNKASFRAQKKLRSRRSARSRSRC